MLPNGDTNKELLARSRYLLYKYEDEWTLNQTQRAAILFEKYPVLKMAYKLSISFRNIYKTINREDAELKFNQWMEM